MMTLFGLCRQFLFNGVAISSSLISVRAALLLTAGCMLSACVAPNPPLYRWGAYEDIIYTGYKDPGSSDPVSDAQLLEAEIERTIAEGRQVPPGLRIHLGYLYFEQGRDDEARSLFETEREVFPESAVFVDRLLSRMGSL